MQLLFDISDGESAKILQQIQRNDPQAWEAAIEDDFVERMQRLQVFTLSSPKQGKHSDTSHLSFTVWDGGFTEEGQDFEFSLEDALMPLEDLEDHQLQAHLAELLRMADAIKAELASRAA